MNLHFQKREGGVSRVLLAPLAPLFQLIILFILLSTLLHALKVMQAQQVYTTCLHGQVLSDGRPTQTEAVNWFAPVH